MRNSWTLPSAADLSASVVVFLVALPLCLGIALGSGAPLLAGIVAGVVGGILVGALSGSHLSVSGPAAGLTAIVAAAVTQLGSWQAFVVAVVLAGLLQIAAGALRLGVLADYIPNSVIKGMLAAIGVLLILKQAPHLVGYDPDFEGDFSFVEHDGHNTFSSIADALRMFQPGAVVIGLVALALLQLWDLPLVKRLPGLRWLPGPLVAVLAGLGLNQLFGTSLRLGSEHLVQLPLASGVGDVAHHLTAPQWSELRNPLVWKAALTLAVVASLETLLGIAAVDKLDPLNRVTPPNRELVAQGVGNTLSGLLGGLPMTSVIVRSSANVNAGATSRWSSVLHGILLLVSACYLAHWLNYVPLAALAAVLIATGYKLAKIQIFKDFYRQGWDQFAPFVVTIVAVVLTDLLTGILIGIAAGLYFHIRSNFQTSMVMVHEQDRYLLRLRKDVSFFVKPRLRQTLEQVPRGAKLLIDISKADYIDHDIVDTLNEFAHHAAANGIAVQVRRNPHRASQSRLAIELPDETILEA